VTCLVDVDVVTLSLSLSLPLFLWRELACWAMLALVQDCLGLYGGFFCMAICMYGNNGLAYERDCRD
jgi:hypothetical protein